MAVRFGARPASVPAFTRQFQTLGPAAALPRADAGKLPEVEPAGAIVPRIFEALEGMAGAAAGRDLAADGAAPADWRKELAKSPTDAEDMAAFARAMESAYLTDKETQISQRGEAIYADNEADLDGFNTRWDNLETTVLDTLADPWKPMAKAELDRQRARYSRRIVGTIRAHDEKDFNDRLGGAADAYTARAAAAAHADDAEELAVLADRHALAIGSRTDLSAEQKAEAHNAFRAGVAAQAELGRLDGIIRDEGLEGAAQYAADFEAGLAGGGKLADAEREPIARLLKARLDDVRSEQRQAEAEKAAKAKSESGRRLAAAEEAIAKGGYGRHELERDLQTNRFADLPDAASRLSAAIETARTDKHAKAEAAARGAEAFAAGKALDAADPEDVAAIDALWKAEKEADPTLGAARAIEIAKCTHVLPAEARDAIADGLLYGTPEKRAEQARALAELIKTAPAAAETLPPELRAEATRITKRLEQGHDPASATEGTDKALEGVGTALMGGAGNDPLDPLEAQADDATQAETDENPFASLEGVQVAGLLTRLLQALGRAPKRTLPAPKGPSVPPKPETPVPPKTKPETRAPIKIEKPTPRPPFSGVPREVLDTAKATGDHIREKLGFAARRLGEGATLLPLEPIAEMALKRFRDMADEGKYKAEFTPGDFGEGLSPSDAIHAFAEAEMNGVLRPAGGQHVAQLNLGKVSPALAEKVLKETGEDISKLHHTIDTIQLRHAFDRHGPGAETDKHQVPISIEAMSGYLHAVESSEVVLGPRRKKVGVTLTFKKRINGTLFVVEQIRTKQGGFVFFDMWIQKQ